MQQLQNASDPCRCSRAILDAMMDLLVNVREKAAHRFTRGKPAGHGPSLIQVRALAVLHKRPGATLSFLADQLALTISATSRLADGLVKKKLIARTVPPRNRRTVALMLTPAGEKILESALRETQAELAPLLSRLPKKKRAALTHAMSALQMLVAKNENPMPAERRDRPGALSPAARQNAAPRSRL